MAERLPLFLVKTTQLAKMFLFLTKSKCPCRYKQKTNCTMAKDKVILAVHERMQLLLPKPLRMASRMRRSHPLQAPGTGTCLLPAPIMAS